MPETQADTKILEAAGLAELVTGVTENSKRLDRLMGEADALWQRAWETHDPQEKARLRPQAEQKKGEWKNTFRELVPKIERLEIALLKAGLPPDGIVRELKTLDFHPPKGCAPQVGIRSGQARLELILDAIPACLARSKEIGQTQVATLPTLRPLSAKGRDLSRHIDAANPTDRPTKLSTRAGTQLHPRQYSKADDDRYKRIGYDEISRHTNRELWLSWQIQERRLKHDVSPQGFRHSLNRIRAYHNLPSSSELQKK